jgi:aminoglycoside phosphotransferase (APT) family kinase protein
VVDSPLDVLDAYGVDAQSLLGYGGEARVYALDTARILRVHHEGTPMRSVAARAELLSELAPCAARLSFAIPEVLETERVAGHIVTIERRLPGRPLTRELDEARGEARTALVRTYMDTAARIADLGLERPWHGDLSRADAIHCESFREFLKRRAADSLRRAGPDFAAIDPAALAAALPEPERPEFVHLDAFPGNMLAESGRVTAVLDFGVVAVMGDRRLEPLAAAAYLATNIARVTSDDDRRVAREWLVERGLEPWLEPARRWLAAFWSLARDDIRLHDWCRSVLL